MSVSPAATAAYSVGPFAALVAMSALTLHPLAILADMLQGVLGVPQSERGRLIIEPDRAAAISLAVATAGKGDVVLVAGKGHERGQYVAGSVIPFDDREVAADALTSAGKGGRPPGMPRASWEERQ